MVPACAIKTATPQNHGARRKHLDHPNQFQTISPRHDLRPQLAMSGFDTSCGDFRFQADSVLVSSNAQLAAACFANSFRVTRPAMDGLCKSSGLLHLVVLSLGAWLDICWRRLSHQPIPVPSSFASHHHLCRMNPHVCFPFLVCHGSNSGCTYHDYVAKSSQTNMCWATRLFVWAVEPLNLRLLFVLRQPQWHHPGALPNRWRPSALWERPAAGGGWKFEKIKRQNAKNLKIHIPELVDNKICKNH